MSGYQASVAVLADDQERLVARQLADAIRQLAHWKVERAGHPAAPELPVFANVEKPGITLAKSPLEFVDVDLRCGSMDWQNHCFLQVHHAALTATGFSRTMAARVVGSVCATGGLDSPYRSFVVSSSGSPRMALCVDYQIVAYLRKYWRFAGVPCWTRTR